MKRKDRKRNTINRRVGIVAGMEGGLAQLGFYSPQVQAVVRKWSARVPEVFLKEYFFAVASAASWLRTTLKITVASRAHWPLIWELGTACERLRNVSKLKPVYWLMRTNLSIITNGKQDDYWCEISAQIIKRGGPNFSTVTLRQAAKRLHLIPPPSLAKAYIKSPILL